MSTGRRRKRLLRRCKVGADEPDHGIAEFGGGDSGATFFQFGLDQLFSGDGV